MSERIREGALAAMGPLRTAMNGASEASAYALTCFHDPNKYWAEHTLKLIVEARKDIQRAEAMLVETLSVSEGAA
jgi:hypothetical protein